MIKRLFSVVGSCEDISVEHETGTKLDLTDQLLVNLIHLLTNMPEEVQLSDHDVDNQRMYVSDEIA